MKTFFADACYWIALLNPHDQLHNMSKEISKNLKEHRMITSEMVLTEFLNGLAGKGSHIRNSSAKATKAILESPNVEVIPQTSPQFRKAIEHYIKHQDKKWGLTDCAACKSWQKNLFLKYLPVITTLNKLDLQY